jgi:hypothetical protein
MFGASLFAAPHVLQEIVVAAVRDSPPGPPTELHAMLLVCRAFHEILSFTSCSHLYARIFNLKFDQRALLRRLGHLDQDEVNVELRRRFTALHCFRLGDIHAPCMLDALLVAYFMVLEDDGRNIALLRWARLMPFLGLFFRSRLFEGAEQNHGWPLQNETNSLAVALFWLMSSHSTCFLPMRDHLLITRIRSFCWQRIAR